MGIICYTFGVLIGFDVEKNIEEISIKKLIVSFYVEYNYCDSQQCIITQKGQRQSRFYDIKSSSNVIR